MTMWVNEKQVYSYAGKPSSYFSDFLLNIYIYIVAKHYTIIALHFI